MSSGDGLRPPGSAEKSLAEIVNDVTSKASQLVREEIDLAKTEVTIKATRIGKGAAAGAIAGVIIVFALIYLFHALAYLFADLLGGTPTSVWLGYLIVFGILLVIAAIAGLLALRFIKKGSPPTPDLAIEEAKRTRAALEEARR